MLGTHKKQDLLGIQTQLLMLFGTVDLGEDIFSDIIWGIILVDSYV